MIKEIGWFTKLMTCEPDGFPLKQQFMMILMLLFRKKWRILISISLLCYIENQNDKKKYYVYHESKPYKIIIPLKIGLEIALFTNCIAIIKILL